ncbi:GNAT family N-acetyltransferase [Dactylosporangium sp. NPDC005572]|uniref:GNAT family N-acetyltransferase n=1 Tax=Dactylosporangium sp. NPDC005572 TaxID=3156889 RepID=UPI0033BE5095
MLMAQARLADIDTIMSWRIERVAWLRTNGYEQWSVPLPRSAVAATVSSGQTWIVWDGDTPVGTITLTAWIGVDELWKPSFDSHDALWLPADDPADALYAAKMMVPLQYAGAGLGREMLEWAAGRAFDAGLSWLRFDAWTTNTDLHEYYRRLGYQHVRTVVSRVSGACFQKPAQPYTGHLLKTQE